MNNKPFTYGLLLSVLMVSAPHAVHLPPWVSALCAALLTWRAHLTRSGDPLPPRWLLTAITLASTGGILVEFHTLFGREVGVTLLLLFTTLKLMELRSARDATVLLYLACFIVITNFLYSQSIPTAIYMLATLLVIVTTWVHMYAPGIAIGPRLRVAATLLLQAIPLTLVLFILFPRVQGPLWGLPQDAFAISGLDDRMAPGSLSRLVLSDEVAFRVTYAGKPPRRDQMYWRGPVLSDFDGRTWTQGIGTIARPQLTGTGQPVDYSVTLEPHNKHWLFALEMPDSVSIPARLTYDFRLLRSEPVKTRLRYDARSFLNYRANPNEIEWQLRSALRLPPSINPRARELARQWRAAVRNDEDVVRSALDYFNRENFRYTLEPPPLSGSNNIDEFLFGTRQGFCEHYASSFVFLMRAAHIPARVVTGYQGGEFNDVVGYYIVRQYDAHAWAEVWLAGEGWVRVDPTAAIAPARVEGNLAAAVTDSAALPFMARNPPQWLRNLRLNWDTLANRWNQWVLGYNNELQFAFLTQLGMESITWQKLALHMTLGVGLMIAAFALFMLRHLIKRQPDKVQAAWLKLCRKLAKAGLPRAAHEGAQDYAERIATLRPDLAEAIHDLADRYSALRYGAEQNEQERNEFLRRAATFKSRRGIIRAS